MGLRREGRAEHGGNFKAILLTFLDRERAVGGDACRRLEANDVEREVAGLALEIGREQAVLAGFLGVEQDARVIIPAAVVVLGDELALRIEQREERVDLLALLIDVVA